MRWSHRRAAPAPRGKTLPTSDGIGHDRRMNRDDDAERRIRELERPLADAAQVSELGTGTPPSRYPPPGYYPPPRHPERRSPARVSQPVVSRPGAEAVARHSSGLDRVRSDRSGPGARGVGIVANQFASTTRSLTTPTSSPASREGGSFTTLRPTTHTSAPSSEASPETPAPPANTESAPSPDGTISVAGNGTEPDIHLQRQRGDGQWCEQYRCPARSLRSRRRVGRREHSHRGQCGRNRRLRHAQPGHIPRRVTRGQSVRNLQQHRPRLSVCPRPGAIAPGLHQRQAPYFCECLGLLAEPDDPPLSDER